jgi:hypothetical protein
MFGNRRFLRWQTQPGYYRISQYVVDNTDWRSAWVTNTGGWYVAVKQPFGQTVRTY